MAISYWDYGTNATNWTGDTGNYINTGGTDTTAGHWVVVYETTSTEPPRRRTIIVKHPTYWDKIAQANYTKLVNNDTQTGWKVTLWFRGDIDIVDPDVEVRTLKEFIPLLKQNASERDRSLIDKFMEIHGSE